MGRSVHLLVTLTLSLQPPNRSDLPLRLLPSRASVSYLQKKKFPEDLLYSVRKMCLQVPDDCLRTSSASPLHLIGVLLATQRDVMKIFEAVPVRRCTVNSGSNSTWKLCSSCFCARAPDATPDQFRESHRSSFVFNLHSISSQCS
jgi:hypothetical protein